MGIVTTQRYVSDITGNELEYKDVIHIKHSYSDETELEGLNQHVNLVTTKKELEDLFGKKINIKNSHSLKDFVTGDYIFDFINGIENNFFRNYPYGGTTREPVKGILESVRREIINLEFWDERSGVFYISLTLPTVKKFFGSYIAIRNII